MIDEESGESGESRAENKKRDESVGVFKKARMAKKGGKRGAGKWRGRHGEQRGAYRKPLPPKKTGAAFSGSSDRDRSGLYHWIKNTSACVRPCAAADA